MDINDPRRLDALVEAIWGREALESAEAVDPEMRDLQNQALSVAIRLYLQSYLDDAGGQQSAS